MSHPMRRRKVYVVLDAAARHLAETGADGVDVFTLAVLAWRAAPRDFGLRGYEDDYPDAKAVSVALQYLLGRENGTRSRPLMERCGPNLVRLTPLGHARLAAPDARRPAAVNAGYVG